MTFLSTLKSDLKFSKEQVTWKIVSILTYLTQKLQASETTIYSKQSKCCTNGCSGPKRNKTQLNQSIYHLIA